MKKYSMMAETERCFVFIINITDFKKGDSSMYNIFIKDDNFETHLENVDSILKVDDKYIFIRKDKIIYELIFKSSFNRDIYYNSVYTDNLNTFYCQKIVRH